MKLGDRAQRVFLSVQRMCEWRVGQSSFPSETVETESGMLLQPEKSPNFARVRASPQ